MFNYYYSAKFCLRDEGSTVQLTMDTCHCLTVRLSSKAALDLVSIIGAFTVGTESFCLRKVAVILNDCS
jgi:hypothetical protein